MDDVQSPKPPQESNQSIADAATFGKPEVQPLAEETQQNQDQPIAGAASGIPEISDIEMADARRTLRTVRRPVNEAEQSNPAADNARQRLIQSQQQRKCMHSLQTCQASSFIDFSLWPALTIPLKTSHQQSDSYASRVFLAKMRTYRACRKLTTILSKLRISSSLTCSSNKNPSS